MDACQGFYSTPFAELDPIGTLVHDLGDPVQTADYLSTRRVPKLTNDLN
jgi:hypothetical protein